MNEKLIIIGPQIVSSEAEYLALRKTHVEADAPSYSIALTGGLIADRMSWAFLAAYQAAIRWCFFGSDCVQNSSELLAFASSEDNKQNEALEGVTGILNQESFIVYGNKTWVAACESIQSLVVKIGRGEGASYWYVPAKTHGLSLTAYASPKRLPELSQGLARFDSVEIPARFKLDDSRVRFFRHAEAFHLLVSVTASVWSQSTRQGFNDIANNCASLSLDLEDLEVRLQKESFKHEFGEIHARVLNTLNSYLERAESSQSRLWKRDLPILMMYAD